MANTSADSKKKRLALFLDGTWNESNDNTNVWRLRSLCAPKGANDVPQLIYYDRGVGTQFGEKISGGLFGAGIDDNVEKAYEWLVENYDDGDDIFIFGFSRGAFTARSLAGMLSVCGLLTPGAPLGVGQLYTRYRHVDRNQRSIRKLFDGIRDGTPPTEREEVWLTKYSRPVEIMMIGVWDTVAALDIPGIGIHEFLDPNLRLDMKNAFHALAIDENRYKFAPTLWTQSSPLDCGKPVIKRDFSSVEQRWFIGAHANIGGGYASDALPQIPLRWIAGKAQALGLELKAPIDVEENAEQDPVTDSYAGFLGGVYQVASKRYHRSISLPPVDRDGYWVTTINETIDASVFERWRSMPGYRPENLVEWAKLVGIDPLSITKDVRADNPHLPLKR